ncbi:TetR/AcrR family transcriptional regulator [Nocardia caishijiensis]|uniref:TetR family transcriptional regulator n=1 Tax=Nocardia caishijiensis TaxID=184756 RepID=A0ABQ6YG99_9NOCA|nr:TetR/AcrR family transcriptional regulator [Nocardia caishijiensis]KAF0844785.1 TetR family transcriptional regulator [Nocardia caishijiensis]
MAAAPLTSTDTADTDDAASRILDAALVQFGHVGVKKTTIEDIARRAGVDRATVYRRVGSRDDVVRAVYAREIARVLTELTSLSDNPDSLEDLVADTLVTVVRRWREHPLVNRLLVLEPERVLPQLTVDSAQTMAMSIASTTTILGQAVDAGLLPDLPDLTARAEIVCRIAHSMILAPSGMLSLTTEDELREFARRYLVPIITR